MTNDARTPEKKVPDGGYRGRWSEKITDEEYLAKILSKCARTPSGCLVWQGWKNHKGYGEIGYRGRSWFVHRLIYKLKIGQIPPRMLVCHKCDVRACCDEAHLFLGTEKDNNQDCGDKGRHHNSVKTHCKRGHPFDEQNTGYKDLGTGSIARVCLTCEEMRMKSPKYRAWSREYQRRRRAEKREKRLAQERRA